MPDMAIMSKEKTNTEKLYDVIKAPLITEKSMAATAQGQYTFEVLKNATKVEIAQAVELAFPGRKVKKPAADQHQCQKVFQILPGRSFFLRGGQAGKNPSSPS